MKGSIVARQLAKLSGAVAVAALATLSPQVGAGQEEEKGQQMHAGYQMKIIGNQAHLAPFQSGDYQAAIDHIVESTATLGTVFMHANNLCVAHTLAGNYEAAKASCDEAVQISRRQARLSFNGSVERANLAIALSNRGVLMVVSSDTVAATSDFVEARKVGRSASPAGANLQKLEEGSAIAVADVGS